MREGRIHPPAAIRRRRQHEHVAAGALVGLGGVGLLLDRNAATATDGTLVGTLAVLVGAVSWSAGIVYSRRSKLSASPLLSSALSLLAGAALLLVAGTAAGEWREVSLAAVAPRSWLALAYLIVFGSLIAFTAYNWLLERYSQTLVATHAYVNPVVAVVLGWWLADEQVTMRAGVAAAMVVGAVVLVDRGVGQLDREARRLP